MKNVLKKIGKALLKLIHIISMIVAVITVFASIPFGIVFAIIQYYVVGLYKYINLSKYIIETLEAMFRAYIEVIKTIIH